MKIKDLEILEQSATPGPWVCNDQLTVSNVNSIRIAECIRPDLSFAIEDAKFIAAFRAAAPKLLAIAKAAKELQEFLPPGDLFGAGRYSAHNVAIHNLQKSLAEVELK